jgi:soluble epoxide hydrolase/lipid-phosphate phosphatase
VIGHDWGSHIAARFALWYPERVMAVIQWVVVCFCGCVSNPFVCGSVSIGYFPPSQTYEPLEEFIKKFPIYKYQLYFGSPACTMELERNVRIALHFGIERQ